MSLRDYPIQEALLNQLLGEPVPHQHSNIANRGDIAAWGKRADTTHWCRVVIKCENDGPWELNTWRGKTEWTPMEFPALVKIILDPLWRGCIGGLPELAADLIEDVRAGLGEKT